MFTAEKGKFNDEHAKKQAKELVTFVKFVSCYNDGKISDNLTNSWYD